MAQNQPQRLIAAVPGQINLHDPNNWPMSYVPCLTYARFNLNLIDQRFVDSCKLSGYAVSRVSHCFNSKSPFCTYSVAYTNLTAGFNYPTDATGKIQLKKITDCIPQNLKIVKKSVQFSPMAYVVEFKTKTCVCIPLDFSIGELLITNIWSTEIDFISESDTESESEEGLYVEDYQIDLLSIVPCKTHDEQNAAQMEWEYFGFDAGENVKEKLDQAIESATEILAEKRVSALQTMCEIMKHRFLPNFIDDRRVTIMDIIEKSIRHGKGSEQALAATLAPLLSIQLSGREEIAKSIRTLLLVTAQNKANEFYARAKCVSALALLNFSSANNINDVLALMQQLEEIFSGSYLKGGGTSSAVAADAGALHAAALNAWGLQVTRIPSTVFCSLMANKSFAPSITNLIGMLQSPHLEVRMATGELIALVLECGRGHDENFLASYLPELIDATQILADGSVFSKQEYRIKFIDILGFVKDKILPHITMRFGTESFEMHTWVAYHQYTALWAIIGPNTMSSFITKKWKEHCESVKGPVAKKVREQEKHKRQDHPEFSPQK